MDKRRRIISFDITRALAIFFVVLCHAQEAIYWWGVGLNTNFQKIISITMSTVGRIGVPFFLFLTGALILKKHIDNDDGVLNFYRKNLLPLIIVNIIWVFIYNITFLLSGRGDEVTVGGVLKEIFFIQNVPLINTWYIPMIVGIYIALPFVSKIVKIFSKKSLYIAAIIVFITSFIFPFINTILSMCGVDGKEFLSTPMDLSFLGGAYGLYILIGYMLTNNKRIKTKSIWLLTIALLSLFITCLMQFISMSAWSHQAFNVWYDFPFLLICSACLFTIINRIDYSKLNKKVLSLITFISKASLAIFFIHIIIQNSLAPHILSLEIISPIKLLLLVIANFTICVTICYALSKIKPISKWVLLIK